MTPVGRKALLLGSGELGKEVALELQRYGVEVIACDRYANAPAMQVAHRSYVIPCNAYGSGRMAYNEPRRHSSSCSRGARTSHLTL